MSQFVERREFLRHCALAGAAAAIAPTLPPPAPAAVRSPNEKLNLGVIGVAARGGSNLAGVESENIVALCDIDESRLDAAAAKHTRAEKYVDFRKLLDRKDLDAVVVSTPDFTHAIPVVRALQQGLDVYCEKPLAHSVHEVRTMRNWAAKQKAVTQMGTQIHAGENYRRVVELVQAGAIGPVSRVHIWHNHKVKPGKRPTEDVAPPSGIHYDLWLGPAPYRPFSEAHFHFNWRYWWDFGNGPYGDFGCHFGDLPFWALELRAPTTVAATGRKTSTGDNDVPDEIVVDWHFPARGEQPPVHMTWYHGDETRPAWAADYKKTAAVLFEGTKGKILADYGTKQVFMGDGSTAVVPAQTIPNSIGHHAEWINAVKTRGPTTCNFDYSGGLAEAVLLGNVAYRAGQKLDWDAAALKATNCPAADQFIRREYRKGWVLEG
jgi:predicted dehydrogenase